MRARYVASFGLLAALITVDGALAKDLNLSRTAKSGVNSPLAYAGRWDRNCNGLPTTVTITKKPASGVVSVIDADEVIPMSTPASGDTSNCAGKTVKSKRIMYLSNPNFHGNDSVSYDSEGGGIVIHTTIAITVQ
jgi:hypothetical protein